MPATGAVRRGLAAELPCDVAFLAGTLPPRVLRAAVLEADRVNAAPHEILLARGAISTIDYYRALADAVGARFSRFVRIGKPMDPLAGRDPGAAARVGMLKVSGRDGMEIAAAPRGAKVAPFVEALRGRNAAARRIFVTPPQALTDAIAACGQAALLEGALNGLGRLPDGLSANALLSPVQVSRRTAVAIAAATLAALGLTAVFPAAAALMVVGFLALFFLGTVGLRISAAILGLVPTRHPRATPLRDADLPVYTVLVPLYREAGQVPRLVKALSRLDYPPHRLDIKMIAEADDGDTLRALRRLDLPSQFEILAVPPAEPRTKPKALCYALAFARGELVTIYDAEDLPEPDQLRRAAERLAALPDDVVCLQARLAWYNWPESWFTRQMSLEYASLFNVILPALARFGLPMPLGGTSNHFRMHALKQVGAWDAYNVTEDADLGLRLARAGYRCDVLDSTTWEEAPVTFRAWLLQRTRWLKGWMQTYFVHMRQPRVVLRQLGVTRFLVMQAVFGGGVLSVFVQPIFAGIIAMQVMNGDIFTSNRQPCARRDQLARPDQSPVWICRRFRRRHRCPEEPVDVVAGAGTGAAAVLLADDFDPRAPRRPATGRQALPLGKDRTRPDRDAGGPAAAGAVPRGPDVVTTPVVATAGGLFRSSR